MIRKSFCNWIPKVPKHKVIITKSSYHQPHAYWDLKDAEKIEITHFHPIKARDKYAFFSMKLLRYFFDFFTGYRPNIMTEKLYLRRAIFLETIAGVPGMIGGMSRHFRAIRTLQDDKGWIHHLLEEAENERMHLSFFLKIRQPGKLMRASIILGQFIFITYYSMIYLISPSTGHRFIGYLEEEAVKTYTQLIQDIDNGRLKEWKDMKAPDDAIEYYGLSKNAKMRDMFICIRADETNHKEYNHHFSEVKSTDLIAGHKIEFIDQDENIVEISDKK